MVANWGSHAFAALVGLSVPVAAFTGFGSQNINTGPGRLKELALEEKAVDLPNGIAPLGPAPLTYYGPGKGTMTDDPPVKGSSVRAYCFEQNKSHFDESLKGQTFCQRYSVNATSYQPGGPIIVFDPGESSADGFFGWNSNLNGWAEHNNGLFIILEHRFYGWSVPTESFSTDDLRLLNMEETLEDTANFIRNFVPYANAVPNLTDPSILRPDKSPWIYVGGSYPGGKAAFMRQQYPELVYGAVSSSGVTVAKFNFWEYFSAVQKYGPQDCIPKIQEAVKVIDQVLDLGEPYATELKTRFGLNGLQNDDFGSVLTKSFLAFQYAEIEAPLSFNTFTNTFCPAIRQTRLASNATIGGIALPDSVLNYADYIKGATSSCTTKFGASACYNSHNNTAALQKDDTDKSWRLWTWQTCNEWGYMMPAPPAGEPSVLSKYLTLDYSYSVCTKAFPPGQVYTLPQRPNYVDKINSRGGYDIAADRLMLIGGEWDPWRPVTPLADTATPRLSTDLRPVRVAPDSSHCSDINNWHASGGERDITQDFELEHVTKWIEQWNAAHNGGITPGASVPAAPVSSAESAEPTPTASQSQSQSQSQAQSESSVPSVSSTVTAPSSAASPSSTPGKNGNGVGHGYGNVGGNGKGNNGNGNGNGGNNGKGHANRKRRIAKDA